MFRSRPEGDKQLALLKKEADKMSQQRSQADSVCDAQYQQDIDSGMSRNEATEKYMDCKFPLRKEGHVVIGGRRWPGRSHKKRRRKSRKKSKRKSTKKKKKKYKEKVQRKRRKSTKKKRRKRRR